MAEFIQKTDTLNEGREKLNAAIQDAEDAKITAEDADYKATQALAKSESTQTQLDTIVIEGDSSVEAAQARVDTKNHVYDTLKQRLDTEYIEVTSQLAQKTQITPDDFEGSDHQKIQQAIDFAIEQKKDAIVFTRMFDITGEGELIVDKGTERTPLRFFGVGGGIIKRDQGYIFNTTKNYISDLHLLGMKIESLQGAGTILFNGRKIYRITTMGINTLNLDTYIYSDTYIQTVHSIGDTFIGGNGYLIDITGGYDFVMSGHTVEHRDGYMIQRYTDRGNNRLNGFYIRSGIIEGLRGQTFQLRSVENFNLDGNFIEQNLGYIEFSEDSTQKNVTIANTRGYEVLERAEGKSFIKWGKTLINCKSENNLFDSMKIHDLSNVETGWLFSVNDTSNIDNIDPNNRLLEQATSKLHYKDEATDTHVFPMGFGTMYTKQTKVPDVNPQEIVTTKITLPIDVTRDSLVSVNVTSAGNNTAVVRNHYTDLSTKELFVVFKNEKDFPLNNVNVIVNILRPSVSAIG